MSDHIHKDKLVTIIKKWFKWSELVLAMLLIQIIAAGMQILTRVVLVKGTFIYALIAYRHAVAAISIAPLAFYFERGQEMRFGWSVCIWLFLNALTGTIFAMGLFFYGLKDTTATYATNFLNLIPIFTFVFSLIFRIEQLKLETKAGKVKSVGALLCVGGALTTCLYNGHQFHFGHHIISHAATKSSTANWTRGTFMLVASCFSFAAWFIVQAKLQKVFPFRYWATMLTCTIACVQSVIVGVCFDRSKSAWKLGWDLQLLTIVYSGVLSTAVTFTLLLWAVSKQGPTYPSMFNPLTLIFVAVAEALILGEAIRVGTLIGSVLIVSGLYSFLWGKEKECKGSSKGGVETDETIGSQLSSVVVPSSSPPRDDFVNNNNIIDVEDQSFHKDQTQKP